MLCRIMRAPILRLAPIVLLLGACATVDRQPGFRTEQVAALENAGFQRVGENYELGLQDRVLFAVDRSDLRPEIAESLARLCEVLISVGIGGAMIEGHADSTGDDAHNQQLSQWRAEAVKIALAREGMPADNIRTWGAGESHPIASNDTEEGRRQNRRVVIVVTPGDASGRD